MYSYKPGVVGGWGFCLCLIWFNVVCFGVVLCGCCGYGFSYNHFYVAEEGVGEGRVVVGLLKQKHNIVSDSID